jgi:hypothetical protein
VPVELTRRQVTNALRRVAAWPRAGEAGASTIPEPSTTWLSMPWPVFADGKGMVDERGAGGALVEVTTE